ncbi:unnamed protein product [Arabidopsis arenosa]|uniref:UBA domain-containing protein n=1 Tax=Arabidopsis arenosa TaxID=38785 RepID=A0A8S1ZLA6_ARAAE|nr:unnamed protein product [Arabidopsis arenosa]
MTEADLNGIPAQAEILPVAEAPSSTVLNKVKIMLGKLKDTSQSLDIFKAVGAKIDSEVSGCKNMAAELIVLSSTGASTASAPAPTATQAIPAQAEIPPVAQAPSSTLLNKVQIMLRELEETSRSLKIFKAVGAKIDFEVSGCKNMAEELIQTDVIGQAASNLVAGTTLDSTVQKILDIGGGSWDYDAVVRALRASSDNPDTAIEYLYSGIPAQAEIPPVAQAPSSTVLNKVQIVLQKLEDTSQSLETFKAEVAKIDSEVSGCKNMAAELIVLSSTGASTASAPAPTATQAIPAQAEIPPVAQAPSSTVLNKVQTMLPKLEETSQSLEICKAEFAKIDSEVSGCKNMAEELIQRDVIGQAASNFVAGTTLDSTVQKPLAMGGCSWDHVVRALRASSDNPVIPPVAQDPSASSQVIPKLKPSLITASRIEKSFQLLKDMQPDKSYLHRQIKLGEAVDELRGKAPRRKEKFLLKKDSRTVKTTEKGTENLVLKKEAMSIDPEMFIEANSFTEQFDMSHPSKKSEKRGLREKTKKGMKSATEQRQSLPPEKSEGSVAEIEEEAKLREGIKPLVDEVADEASISLSLMQELAKYESAEREVRRLLWIIMENESNEEKERLKSRFENAKASGKAFVREMLQASDKEKALEIVKKERRTTDHGVQKFKLEVTKLEKQKKRQQEKEKQEQKKQQEKEKQEQKKQQPQKKKKR